MSGLTELQERMADALRERRALPLDPEWSRFAAEHVGGSSRLSPAEQLEIYREQFWLRHTSSLVEDFPGLGGILGQKDWEKLAEAYLSQVAPTSYTLRDLGLKLPQLIDGATWLSHQALCLDMARLEVAYIEVFDAPDTLPVTPERLAAIPEASLADARLVVAPSVRLLTLRYPVADLRRKLRLESDEPVPIPAPEPEPFHLVVYRRDLRLWDMPLSSVAFAFLSGLQRGETLGAAAEGAASSPQAEAELGTHLGEWLRQWSSKGLIHDAVV